MFFASPTEANGVSTVSRTWECIHEDKQEMSVDELISDFHRSATSRFSQEAKASPLPFPKYFKPKQSSRLVSHLRADPVKTIANRFMVKQQERDELIDNDSAVSPMPRIDYALNNKPSFVARRITAPRARASTQFTPMPRKMPQAKPPVLSPRSLTPSSLSPVTSLIITSSGSERVSEPVTSDSVDAVMRTEVRERNDFVFAKRRTKAHDNAKLKKISREIRQDTSLGRPKDLRALLRLQVPKANSRAEALESPPPPPPPEDSKDETDDSFAEKIRQLKARWRFDSLYTKESEKESKIEESALESRDVCVALKVRNASNELLLETLKPLENRLHAEKAETNKDTKTVESTKSLELQFATQAIVSQLDMAFADMAKRQKADLVADKIAAIAVKDAEAKEKEAADGKKKTEARVQEMEIFRCVPLYGKLLTCPGDIDQIMEQLDSIDTPLQREDALDAEMCALRHHTQCTVQEIEAKTSVAEVKKEAVSLKVTDWVRDRFESDIQMRQVKSDISAVEAKSAGNDETFGEILQRQVVDNLDLTMLRLRHVLAVDVKEAAELKETQDRERKDHEKKKLLQQMKDEQKECDERDAAIARRRVLGLTTIDEVDDWIDEGRRLEGKFDHDQPLSRLLASMENRVKIEKERNIPFVIANSMPQEDDRTSYETQLLCGNYALESSSSASRGCGYKKEMRKRLYKLRRTEGTSCENSDFLVDLLRLKPVANHWASVTSPPRQSLGLSCTSHERNEKNIQDDEHFVSQAKKMNRKQGAMSSQREIKRTIQVLQADRRQKSTWIKSCRCA